MKKLLVVLMVLSMATIANAGLVIGVGGQDMPDSEVTLMPSDTAMISVISDGATYILGNGGTFLLIRPWLAEY